MKKLTRLFLCTVCKNPGLRAGPEIIFSREALCSALDFLVKREPESGGLLFGPFNQAGVDEFVGDQEGSRNASSCIYSPDHETLNQVAESRSRHDREMKGIIHTHPSFGGATFPSNEAGYGRGDRGYARKFFDYNESAQFLLFPILTYNDSEITISPFVFERGSNGAAPQLMWAPFRVASPEDFGPWDYNPDWLNSVLAIEQSTKEERK